MSALEDRQLKYITTGIEFVMTSIKVYIGNADANNNLSELITLNFF